MCMRHLHPKKNSSRQWSKGKITMENALRPLRRNGAVVVLILILVAVSTAAPGILRWRAINGLLQDNAPLLILIVGATLPILLGCLDLSIAAMASLAAVVAAMLSPQPQERPLPQSKGP